MDNVLAIVGKVPSQVGRNDDDFADRLSYRYTTLLLVFFSIITSTSKFVGSPITCWVPAHFTGSHEEYTNNYCWVKSTYYLDFDEYVPHEHETDQRYMISYYQWVPMILLVQALFFYLPCMIWRSMNGRSGIDVNEIVETSEDLQRGKDMGGQSAILNKVAKQAKRYFDNISRYHKVINSEDGEYRLSKPCCLGVRTRSGNYLVFLYMICKVLYLVNMVVQLIMMNEILGSDYHLYGFHVLSSLLQGKEWRSAERFPRATMCDLKVRRLGNLQRYTVQCVLPINLFNEMIFLIAWFWIVILLVVSVYAMISWIAKLTSSGDDTRFIEKHLKYRNRIPKDSDLKDFVERGLRKDGVFVMRLIGINTDAVTVTDVVNALWKNYFPDDDSVSQASTSNVTD